MGVSAGLGGGRAWPAQARVWLELPSPALRLILADHPPATDFLRMQVAALDLPLNGEAARLSQCGGLRGGEHAITVTRLHR